MKACCHLFFAVLSEGLLTQIMIELLGIQTISLLTRNSQKCTCSICKVACSKQKSISESLDHGDSSFSVRLLRNIDLIEKALPRRLYGFLSALRALEEVRISCFGQDLLPNFRQNINHFKHCYSALGISVTTKAHILFSHVAEFCQKKEKGLGFFSEKASESVHSDFKKTWESFRVSSQHPQF